MNKFWITHEVTWFTVTVVPIVQLLLVIVLFWGIISLLLRIFYPEFIKSKLIEEYSEQIRKEYDFTKEEWYGE
jgi:hypothetical protein